MSSVRALAHPPAEDSFTPKPACLEASRAVDACSDPARRVLKGRTAGQQPKDSQGQGGRAGDAADGEGVTGLA